MNRKISQIFFIIIALSLISATKETVAERNKIQERLAPTNVLHRFMKAAVLGDKETIKKIILFKELIIKYSKEIPHWALEKKYSDKEFEELKDEFISDCLKKEEWKMISDIGFDVIGEEIKGGQAIVAILAPHQKGKRKFKEEIHFFLRNEEWKLDILWPVIKVHMLHIHTKKYSEYFDYINDYSNIADLGPAGVPYMISLLVCGYGNTDVQKYAYLTSTTNENVRNEYRKLLQSEDKDIRFHSAIVLWLAGDKSCMPVFIDLLDASGFCMDGFSIDFSESEKLEERADVLVRWLETITGKSFPSDLPELASREKHLKAIKKKWQQWWKENKDTFELKSVLEVQMERQKKADKKQSKETKQER